MRIPRKLANLNDAIEVLDQHFLAAKRELPKGNLEAHTALAWTLLSPLEAQFIAEELEQCVMDRRHFLQNYFCIQPETGIITTLASMWDHQHMVDEAIEREIQATGQARVIVLKPRQAGITEYSTGVMCWRTFFMPNAYTISVAQAPDVAAHIQRKINITWRLLPWWMRPERQYHSKGEFMEFSRRDAAESMTNPGLGSVFVTTHAQRSTGIAIGRTTRSLHMCLSATNQVIDAKGYHKSIADVQLGDWVRTPKGSARVTAFSAKPASSVYPEAENGYKITPWCGGAFPVEGTGNHKIVCAAYKQGNPKKGIGHANTILLSKSMKELREVTKTDKVVYPVRKITANFIESDDFKFMQAPVQTGHKREQKGGFISKWTPPAPSQEFGFAIGLYIAEGCVARGRHDVILALDQDESELANRFTAAVGYPGTLHQSKTSRTARHHYYCAAMADWFREYIGAKDEKHIPAWAWHCGKDFLAGILEGLVLGDGSISTNVNNIVQFTSTRAHLAVEVRDIGAALGVGWSAMTKAAAGVRYGRNCQARYDVIFANTASDALRLRYGWAIHPRSERVRTKRDTTSKSHWFYNEDRTEVHVSIRLIERVRLDQVYDIEVDSPEHEFLLPCFQTSNSEVSRWPSGESFSGDIEPSLNAPDTIAICESTALGDNGFYANMWAEASESSDPEWIPVFLPAYRAKKFSLPLKPAQQPFVLTDLELALRERVQVEEKFNVTDEFFNWRRRRLASAIRRTGYPYAHFESFPVSAAEAFQSSGLGAFPRHKLDEQEQGNVRTPGWIGEILYQGMHGAPKLIGKAVAPGTPLEKRETTNRLYVWEPPRAQAAYYIAADGGAGVQGGDFEVIEVFRAGFGSAPDVQVAEWVGWAAPVEFAKIVYALLMYFGKPEVAIEYAKEGMITANYMANDLEYPNIYRPRSEDRIGKQMANYLHWQTTGKTKPLIVGRMIETLLEDGIVIRSKYLLAEMRKFSKDGGGYSGLGSKDDACMATCICLYCLRQTMPELRAPNHASDANQQSPTRSARPSGSPGALTYGLYDQFFRLRAQTPDLAKANDFLQQHPDWRIKPIPVTKANTAYSVIHHGTGVENELYRQHGMDSGDILPGVVTAWRGTRSADQGQETREWDAMAAGELWGVGE